MAWESLESAMVVAGYAALGQSVSYIARDAATKTIYAIVDDGSTTIGFESESSEDITEARVKVSDIETPRRGDRIEMASGKAYMVDGVETLNNVEWRLFLTERDR